MDPSGGFQGGESSYRFSAMNSQIGGATARDALGNSSSNVFHGSMAQRNSFSDSQRGSDVFVRGSLLDRHIEATAFTSKDAPERARDYKGRIRVSISSVRISTIDPLTAFSLCRHGRAFCCCYCW